MLQKILVFLAIVSSILVIGNTLLSLDKIQNSIEYVPSYHFQTDEFSDSDVIWGAKNYVADGFFTNNLFPNLKGSNGKDKDFIYMGYPSLPFLFVGILLQMGLTIYQIKLVNAFLLITGALIIALCISQTFSFENKIFNFAIIISCLATSWFYDNLGSIHQRPLGLFLLALIVYTSIRPLRLHSYFGLLTYSFFLANVSYEYYFLTIIFLFGFFFLTNNFGKDSFIKIVLIFSGFCTGFLSHIIRSLFTVSSYSLLGALHSRLLGVDNLGYLTPNAFDLISSFDSIFKYNFSIHFIIILLLLLWLMKDQPAAKKIGSMLLFLSGMSWALVMKQHFFVHFHVMPFHAGWVIFTLGCILLCVRKKKVTILFLVYIIYLQTYYMRNTNSEHFKWYAFQKGITIIAKNENWHKLSNKLNLIDGIIKNGNFWTVNNDPISESSSDPLLIQYPSDVNANLLELYFPIFGADYLSFVPDEIHLTLRKKDFVVFEDILVPAAGELYYTNNRDMSMAKVRYALKARLNFTEASFIFTSKPQCGYQKKHTRISEIIWK